MSDWCKYWSSAKIIRIKPGVFRFVKSDDSLDVYVDQRAGRNFGVLYLYKEPGTEGCIACNGEESEFLESMIRR